MKTLWIMGYKHKFTSKDKWGQVRQELRPESKNKGATDMSQNLNWSQLIPNLMLLLSPAFLEHSEYRKCPVLITAQAFTKHSSF